MSAARDRRCWSWLVHDPPVKTSRDPVRFACRASQLQQPHDDVLRVPRSVTPCDAGALRCDLGARSHRDPDLRLRQGRRVVDALIFESRSAR